MKCVLLGILIILCTSADSQTIQSPDEFLPHSIGDQFTPHHLLIDYYEYVADMSPKVMLEQYGSTYEDRPLQLAFISTPENLSKLEDIRWDNLRRAGVQTGNAKAELPGLAIVWLSFSVHGNEAAGSESAMPILYQLATSEKAAGWLENTLVILDPCINPDGYSRYTHWNRRYANELLNVDANAIEHREPWPGGRTNHYLFDLNRDWAWQTQIESQQRMKIYLDWLPHIHADFHEMGYTSPYFFAPAAQPYHNAITNWQVEFQKTIGRNHAKHFEENGWLFYTREVFDLLYPSYGDTYPMYHGAIGMTYEQGGSSRASRGILLPTGDTLLLHDRIAHHVTTALSTVEVGSTHSTKMIEEFEAFYQQKLPLGDASYSSYLIRSLHPGKLADFIALLDKNRIEYHATTVESVTGINLRTNQLQESVATENALVIPLDQPFGLFADILLEPEPILVDSLTYDITAWSAALAYGLEAYQVEKKLPLTNYVPVNIPSEVLPKQYAYLISWGDQNASRGVAYLLDKGVSLRSASTPFSIEGKQYAAGTVLALRGDNRRLGSKLATYLSEAAALGLAVTSVSSSWVDAGPDFGSNDMRSIRKPKVLALMDGGTSSLSVGQVWHHFEQELHYPITLISAEDLENVSLDDYTVLVMPEGSYRWGEALRNTVSEWISDGGKLIALGQAVRAIESLESSHIKRIASNEDDQDEIQVEYALRERQQVSGTIPGAIIRTEMDETHPLSFGMTVPYFSIKTGATLFTEIKEGWNAATVEQEPYFYGFIGHQVQNSLAKSLVYGEESTGSGTIVYLPDNPLFRSFWNEGKLLFDNALFHAGN